MDESYLIGALIGIGYAAFSVPRMIKRANNQSYEELIQTKPRDLVEMQSGYTVDLTYNRIESAAKMNGYDISYLSKERGCIILGQPVSGFSFGFFYPVYVSPVAEGASVQVGIKSRLMQDQLWNPIRGQRKKRLVNLIKNTIDPKYIEASLFEYGYKTNENVFCGTLPKAISEKQQLLSVLASTLKFPEYFGMNWDALNDCLCDFSWTDKKTIALVHQDVPLMNNKKEQHTYLEILSNALHQWKNDGKQRFVVSFPLESKNYLDSINKNSAKNSL